MVRVGILKEDDRVELIEGQILQMDALTDDHVWCVAQLDRILQRALAQEIVLVQSPLHLSDVHEPRPDVAVLRYNEAFYWRCLPVPTDVLLLIEVAGTEAAEIRDSKLGLYARYGLIETWLVDLSHSLVEVHRTPSPEGYRDVRIFRRGEQVSPLAFPDLVLDVDAILGPNPSR